jgi:hypothetical protein
MIETDWGLPLKLDKRGLAADFRVLTPHVSTKGAIEKIMSCYVFHVLLGRDAYPLTATCYAWTLVNRIDLSGIALMNLPARDVQIPQDKSVNFPVHNRHFYPTP